MITNEDINNALLKYRGYRQYHGNKDNLSPLMFFFLMDASFQVFDKDVSKQTCKGKEKAYMRRMKEAYHLFFKDFFAAFNVEQTDYLMDKVDAFEEYIQHPLNIAEIAIQECDNSLPIETQREISRTWLCNRFASEAQCFYQRVWKKDGFKLRGILFTKPDTDKDIDAILKFSLDLTERHYGRGEDVTPKHYEKFQACLAALTRKICDWINRDYTSEIKSKTK